MLKPSIHRTLCDEVAHHPVDLNIRRIGGNGVEILARLIELKPGSSEQVHDWAKFISEHRLAALETLRAEGVMIESWFSLSLHDKDYLLCYMRVDSMSRAEQVAASSSNPVDVYHQQFKVNTWVRGAGCEGKLLVDLHDSKN